MMRGLYSLAMRAAQPFVRAKLRRRGAAEPEYLQHVEERFGCYSQAAEPGRTWIHAVSLGETRGAAVLIAKLRIQRPDLRFLLTHGTATGRLEGAKLLCAGDLQAWLPWDTPRAVHRFLLHFKPCLGVLMETEVWPNLAAACKEQGIALVLANARLSEKSMRAALRVRGLSQPAYASLAAVWAQTREDARRLAQVGASVKGVFGNLKFDAVIDTAQLAQGRAIRKGLGRPVVLFASSREGEEAGFLRMLLLARELAGSGRAQHAAQLQAGKVQWLLVPRHPQRFDAVAAMAHAQGLVVARRSAWDSEPPQADLWLGDSLGEMALYYGLSDVALLGGSFAPLGGQNLIEAAACGCPVVMGPHTFNFAEAAQLAQEAGAALRAQSMDDAVRIALRLIADPARQRAAVDAAGRFAVAHRGASGKTAQAVLAQINGHAAA